MRTRQEIEYALAAQQADLKRWEELARNSEFGFASGMVQETVLIIEWLKWVLEEQPVKLDPMKRMTASSAKRLVTMDEDTSC